MRPRDHDHVLDVMHHKGRTLIPDATGRVGLTEALCMRPYTPKEKARITAGAVASLVIVGWLVVLALVFLSVR
jgi:hypothetical protein